MIGQRIESRPGRPWVVIVLVAAGLGLVVAGEVLAVRDLTVLAVLPFAVSGALWVLAPSRPFAATFTDRAIVIEDPPATVPYASLQTVWAVSYPHDPACFSARRCTIHVHHEAGWFTIPARLNVRSDQAYAFLARRLPKSGSHDVNPVLAEYLERQESEFGPQSVATYCALTRRMWPLLYRPFKAFCIGLMVCGAAWVAIGYLSARFGNWRYAGMVCAIFGVPLYLAGHAERLFAGRMVWNWKRSSLVIGPGGMAMVQGHLKGELRWPELLGVRLLPRDESTAERNSRASGNRVGVVLEVDGAEILIPEIYDRPLHVIYDRILEASTSRASPRPGDGT